MRYFSAAEAQQYLETQYEMRYSMSALNKYRAEGTGPRCVKLAGKIWYCDSDIDSWVSSAVRVRPAAISSQIFAAGIVSRQTM